MDYKQKYLKYKQKYLDLKGGRHRFKIGDQVTVKDSTILSTITGVLSDGMNYMINQSGTELGVHEYNLIGKCPFKVGDIVYVKFPLRVFNINGQLRGLSEEEIINKPSDIVAVDQEINIPADNRITVLEVLFKDSLIPFF